MFMVNFTETPPHIKVYINLLPLSRILTNEQTKVAMLIDRFWCKLVKN